MIKESLPQHLQRELHQMLKQPRYIECFMVRTPLLPLRQNHKTQMLFVVLFAVIYLTQLFLIVPSKFMPQSFRLKNIIFWVCDYHCVNCAFDIILYSIQTKSWVSETSVALCWAAGQSASLWDVSWLRSVADSSFQALRYLQSVCWKIRPSLSLA